MPILQPTITDDSLLALPVLALTAAVQAPTEVDGDAIELPAIALSLFLWEAGYCTVTGTLDPNIAGTFTYGGTFNAQPFYLREVGTSPIVVWYLCYVNDGGRYSWRIKTALADAGTGETTFWLGGASINGDYAPSGSFPPTGTATVVQTAEGASLTDDTAVTLPVTALVAAVQQPTVQDGTVVLLPVLTLTATVNGLSIIDPGQNVGPIVVAAGQVYSLGAYAGQAYVMGAQVAETYTMGAAEGQVVP